MTNHSSDDTCGLRQAATRFSLVYWGGVFIFLSILWGLAGTGPIESGMGKLLLYASCPVVTAGLSALLFRVHERSLAEHPSENSLPLLVGVSFILSLAAAPAWATLGHLIEAVYRWPQVAVLDWKEFGYDTAYGASLFFAWSCLLITLVFGFELSDRARRLAAVREEALSAQMRALRYQVNPHFLFNTLNSIAGLIEEGSVTQAERMVLSLSTFLRTTLSLDPMHDVSLEDELSLQEEYLGIERERFSDRLVFSIDMPDEVRAALVPSLILQPLIENAIKHGVGAMRGPVGITLHAHRNGTRLHLWVENDAPLPDAQGSRPPGMGVGLRNVAERLRTRFGEEGQFSAGFIAPGRYRAAIDLPWRRA
ncbi:histidine kinase [Zoogloea sp.]|uniref:sensor histidine kinase n=1 Tax=Zoogloea sp. TaxID=49181 RepID=UPI001416105C|nr:MAG: sensor histidine kinase [Zoogloea sp.]